jgi:hypothetical protein
MFEIEYICEGVYDLWIRNSDDDYDCEYAGTFDSYEEAWDEAYAIALFCWAAKDYTL